MSGEMRIKVSSEEAWYHVCSRVAGRKGAYPIADSAVQYQFLQMIRFYTQAFACQLATVTNMGNHVPLVIRFEKPRQLSAGERMERALRFYPNSKTFLQLWSEEKLQRFEKRIFDVSEFMRSLQSRFAL